MASRNWRKGLWWDAVAGGWRVVATGRVLTPTGLKRRKTVTARPPPKRRKAATRKPLKPKALKRKASKAEPKPQPRKKPAKKPKPKPASWRKGLVWDPDVEAWYVIKTDRYLTDVGVKRRKTAAKPKPKPKPRRKPAPKPRKRVVAPKPRKRVTPKPKPKPRKRMRMPKRKPKPKRTKVQVEEQQNAVRRMLGKLQSVVDGLDYSAVPRVHPNRDGSVDGELVVRIKRGQNPKTVVMDVKELIGGMSGAWISGGIRFTPRNAEDTAEFWKRYDRVAGMAEFTTRYSRDVGPKRLANLVGQAVLIEQQKEAGYRKPEQFVLRLHWNPENTKPAVYRRKD